MQAVSIPDQLFAQAQHEAAANGVTVSAYVASLISQAVQSDPDNFDHFFTPSVIAELDEIVAEIDAGGKTYSSAEVDDHFIQKRNAWLANHPS